jgi:hypothetical protein
VFALFAAIHENDEATSAVKGILTVPPLQIVAEVALVTLGNGFTVTVAVIAAPGQAFAVGVIVYVAVPIAAAVVLNVCAIVDPEEALAPLTPDWVTVHA